MSTNAIKQTASRVWAHRRGIFIGVFMAGVITQFGVVRYRQIKADTVLPDTYLTWRVFDGSIVEVKTPPTIGMLLGAPSSGDQPVRVLALDQVVETLRRAKDDDRIRGIIGDFSSLHVPRFVMKRPLSLAQSEEVLAALQEFREAKAKRFGTDEPATMAWSDTFDSQTSYLLAAGFDRVYMQSSGMVPLQGVGGSLPFFRRILRAFGIKVLSETREEYKSMTSPFTQDNLPPEQLANLSQVYGDLMRNLARHIGAHRFAKPGAPRHEATNWAERVLQNGPYTASEALELGLIDGICHKHERNLQLDEKTPQKSFPQYAQICEKTRSPIVGSNSKTVGVVYLQGAMDRVSKPFSVSEAIKGLQSAAKDDKIDAIVLRINSGGGEVIASESLWATIQDVRLRTNKPVVASFGSVAASGAYYAASAADAIFANGSTITGSIGVAYMRPVVLHELLDKLHLGLQTILAGSSNSSVLQALDDTQMARLRKHTDEMYADFLGKVMNGRGMTREVLATMAGGRVMTGLTAYLRCRPASAAMMVRSGEPPVAIANDFVAWTTQIEPNESGNDVVRVVPDEDKTITEQDLTLLAPSSHGRGLIDAIGGLSDAARFAIHLCRTRAGEEAPINEVPFKLVRVPVQLPFLQQLMQGKGMFDPENMSLGMFDLMQMWTTMAYNVLHDWQKTSVHMRAEISSIPEA